MLKKRLISVLILRDGQVVQSIQFKHTNVIHWNPATAVDFFNTWSVDEIVLLDVSPKKKKRQKFYDAVDAISRKCFVPLAVGGWVDGVDEMRKLLRLGADKIVINTEAFRNSSLLNQGAEAFGSQCMVVSIDAKRDENGLYDVHIDRGKEPTGVTPMGWAVQAESAGAGELFVNCINNDGFRQGYDLQLIKSVSDVVSIPIIAMGGVLEWQHLVDGVVEGGADAVAAANLFHYTEHSTKKAKEHMRKQGLDVR